MDYEEELKLILEWNGQHKIDWEDYRKFKLGLTNNKMNTESKLEGALYTLLCFIHSYEQLKEETGHPEKVFKKGNFKVEKHYQDMREGKKIAYKTAITKERVEEALRNNNGHRALAAKELGCSTKTIYNRLRGQ